MANWGKITRRSLLVGSAAIAGGVAFGVYQYKQDWPNPLKVGDGDVTLNPFLIINQDGITVVSGRAEMGQGVSTTLAALVADELDVPWENVKSIHGPAAAAYYNKAGFYPLLPFIEYQNSSMRQFMVGSVDVMTKFLGGQATGGSSSVVDGFVKLRTAGAAARHTLLAAAAKKWKIPKSSLKTDNGFVVAPDGRKSSYQELAPAAAKIPPPKNPKLKPQSDWKYVGKSVPRLDQRAKVTGKAQYSIDVRLKDMVYATVRMNPQLGAPMKAFSADKAEQLKGVLKVVDMGGGVGVIAENTWTAFKAIELVEVEWSKPQKPHNSKTVHEALKKALDEKPNASWRNVGDAEQAIKDAGNVVEATYHVPYLAHATMEPMNATALLKDGGLTIWAGNQGATIVRDQAAQASGIDASKIKVFTPYLGGGFGRRGEADFTNQAVKLAMEMPGRPVKLTWTREEDMRHDFYRPAASARMQGVVGENGPTAVLADLAAPSTYRQFMGRALGMTPPGPDKLLVEALFDQPYAIPNYLVHGHIADIDLPIGSWRSVGNSYNAFFHESFMDELARSKKLDPVAMRLELLKNEHKPSWEVVRTVAEMANWNGQKQEGVGRGIAFTTSYGAPTAQIIEVRQTDRGIKIEKVWCAVDVGIALDPNNIKAQIFSAAIFGLSAAVSGEITFDDSAAQQSNFHDYDGLRMHQAPAFEVEVLENNEQICGAGEPGTPPSMPALANAVFDLTGKRIRELPLNKHVDFI